MSHQFFIDELSHIHFQVALGGNMKRLMLRCVVITILVVGMIDSSNIKPVQADSSISLDALDQAYVQNFDTLSASGSSDLLPQGWSIAESGSSADNLYNSSTGSQSGGNTYSFGAEGSSERALGGVLSTDLVPLFGASFANHTGGTIQTLVISFTGEQWRCGRTARRDYITFEYSINATSLTTGTWIQVPELEFSTLDSSRIGAKDGNDSTHHQTLSTTITGLNIEIGEHFWIRWSDHDAINGNDDGLAVDDLSITPSGVDLSPKVVAIVPEDQTSSVPLESNLSVTFSEPVDLVSSWFTLSCSSSGIHTAAISGGPQQYSLTPDHPFDNSETCTFTILAGQVRDQDSADPPDEMPQNTTVQFSTIPKPDDPPLITSLFPQNGTSSIDPLSSIQLSFSEAVDLDENWFSLACSKSGDHQASQVENGLSITLIPENSLMYDEDCSLTIYADSVHDKDSIDPPDQMSADVHSTFHTLPVPDLAPYINTFSPYNGQTNVDIDDNLSVEFSEPVFLNSGWFSLQCSQSGDHSATLSGMGTQYVLDPNMDFSYEEECVFQVYSQHVNDSDTNDPPDVMSLDQTIRFQTKPNPDTRPEVVYSIPEHQAINLAPDTHITLDFNEPVSIQTDGVSLICSSSGAHLFEISGSSQTLVIDPVIPFEPNETCILRLQANAVSDQDSIDPPEGLAEDFLIEFTIAPPADSAPVILATSPANNATGVDIAYRQTITFSEPVWLETGWVSLNCSKSGSQPLFLSEGPITYRFEADHNLSYDESCQVTIFADKVWDEDDVDPPDTMPVDYSFRFRTMTDPEIPPFPSVVFGETTIPQPGWVFTSGIHEFSIQFDKEVLHNGSEDAADNPQNYRLINSGTNHVLETSDCELTNGDDILVPIDQITYDVSHKIANITLNQSQDLPNGSYRLIVCGSHTIRDLDGNAINNGTNIIIDFRVAITSAEPDPSPTPGTPGNQPDNASTNATEKDPQPGPIIPLTGFAPEINPYLPEQSVRYDDLGDLWLEIPSMKVELPITGVPQQNGTWDVTWLGEEAGWLEGSAFPTAMGNSVLTGHVWDVFNQPGPFLGIEELRYNDAIIVHHFNEQYLYRVREVLLVNPKNIKSMLKHQDSAWLTLVTCQGYDETTGSYDSRILVRAELVQIK